MIVLFAVMIILLIPALWAYSYIWRGLNRRVIAAVKVVDPADNSRALCHGMLGALNSMGGHQYLGDRYRSTGWKYRNSERRSFMRSLGRVLGFDALFGRANPR